MSRLDLNLSRRPFTNDTLLWILVGALSAMVVGSTAWNAVLFATTGSQVATLNARRGSLESERRAAAGAEKNLLKTISKARTELLASKATFANVIIQEWSFSWTELFNELEHVMPMGVRLTNIRPRVDDGLWIRLDGVAKNSQSFWELQENLMNWPVFGNVYPDVVQPSTVRSGMSQGDLLISLEMEYFPDAREKLGLEDEVIKVEAEQPAAPAGPPVMEKETIETRAEKAAVPEADQKPVPVVDKEKESRAVVKSPRPGRKRRGRGAAAGNRHGRRGHRPKVRVGVERSTPLPAGQPGMSAPDIHGLAVPSGGVILDRPVVVTPDRRILNEEGQEISVQELINQPGGIRPRSAGALKPGEKGQEKDHEKSGGKGKSKPPSPQAGKHP